MPIAESPIVIFCVVAYLIACAGIGVWAMRRTHSIADFLVAGRTLGPIVLVIAAMSSIMSGFGFVGGPGLVFESGASSLWITFSATFGFALGWILVGKRLRLLAAAREILTLPDAVAARYGGRLPRFMMALAILLGVVGYLGTQVLAIGMVLVAVLGVKLPVALLIGLGVIYADNVVRGSAMAQDFGSPVALFILFTLVALLNRCWDGCEKPGTSRPPKSPYLHHGPHCGDDFGHGVDRVLHPVPERRPVLCHA